MKRKREGERGSFTVEAVLVLPIFMFAFLAISSMAIAAKVEATTQYAIDQTAKEISRYCYIAARANLIAGDSGSDPNIDKADDAIGAIFEFGTVFGDTAEKYVPSGGNTDFMAQLQSMTDNLESGGLQNDYNAVSESAKKVYESGKALLEDPKGAILALTKVVASKAASAAISRVVATPLCKALVPKYITTSSDPDSLFERWGVVDGLDGLDFSMSTFLMDGRTINVVVVYTLKVHGFGIFDQTLVVKQSASTAAWVTSSGMKLSEVASSQSKWSKGDLQRGEEFVAELKAENSGKGVKGGVGVDLYDVDTNTFTSVHSLNVFTSSYSDYKKTDGEDTVDNYLLKRSAIKSRIKSYANTLDKNVKKIGDEIVMDDGRKVQTANDDIMKRNKALIIVLPNEASKSSDLSTLNEIAKEIEEETGVTVSFTYREDALGGGEEE